MKADTPELLFATRDGFRIWLGENAATSDGIWLIFEKKKAVMTLSVNDALEEALCYGRIDGQMKNIDDTQYRKYFACRQTKSPWSDKNKKIIETLRNRKMMTNLGEKAVEEAKKNGMWDASLSGAISDEQIGSFSEKLSDFPPAYENFMKSTP